MRLPHHPDRVERLRVPTPADPWRVLISACLTGVPCTVDGTDSGLRAALPPWAGDPRVRLVPFCPEHHRLGTPRLMPDLHGGDGFDVLDGRATMRDDRGADITAEVVEGAEAMVALARAEQVDFALLTDRSGTCGSQVVSIGCRLVPPIAYRHGVGVATAALLRAGFDVVSQRDPRTLGRLGGRLDPRWSAPADAVDHHRHPWVLEHLGEAPTLG